MSEDKKKQRTKRAPKSGDRPAPRSKKRKKEEDEGQSMHPSTEPVMTNLKHVRQLESNVQFFNDPQDFHPYF